MNRASKLEGRSFLATTFLIALICLTVGIQPTPPAAAGAAVPASPPAAASAFDVLTVGILPFQARDEQLARDMTELFAAHLSAVPQLTLVERSRLDQVLQELGLSKVGVADPQTAQQVGYLASAEVLLWGRLFLIDSQIMVTVRVVGVETGRVFVEHVRGSQTDQLVPLLDQLARKVQQRILSERSALVAPDVRDDLQANLNQLAARLQGKPLPKVAILIDEHHLGGVAFDPTAETELMFWFTRCTIPVFDISSSRRQLSGWARERPLEGPWNVPSVIPEDVTVIVLGEAFSEPVGTFGPLKTARCRVEARALDRTTGAVIAVARRTGTYADAAMVSAAKNAIQRAAAGIAYEIIPNVAAHVSAGRSANPTSGLAPPGGD
jgi:TolB-like protein